VEEDVQAKGLSVFRVMLLFDNAERIFNPVVSPTAWTMESLGYTFGRFTLDGPRATKSNVARSKREVATDFQENAV
jgi:hypothetical protein